MCTPEAVVQTDGMRESYLYDAESRLLEYTDLLKQSTHFHPDGSEDNYTYAVVQVEGNKYVYISNKREFF